MAGQHILTPFQLQLLDRPLVALQLPLRLINALENSEGRENRRGNVVQITTVRELLMTELADLSSIPNVGPTLLADIKAKLADVGFSTDKSGRMCVVPENQESPLVRPVVNTQYAAACRRIAYDD